MDVLVDPLNNRLVAVLIGITVWSFWLVVDDDVFADARTLIMVNGVLPMVIVRPIGSWNPNSSCAVDVSSTVTAASLDTSLELMNRFLEIDRARTDIHCGVVSIIDVVYVVESTVSVVDWLVLGVTVVMFGVTWCEDRASASVTVSEDVELVLPCTLDVVLLFGEMISRLVSSELIVVDTCVCASLLRLMVRMTVAMLIRMFSIVRPDCSRCERIASNAVWNVSNQLILIFSRTAASWCRTRSVRRVIGLCALFGL